LLSANGENSNPANLDEATLQLIQEKLLEPSRLKVSREYDIRDDIRDELRENYNVNVNDRTREWRIEPQANDNGNYNAPAPASEDDNEPTAIDDVKDVGPSPEDLASLTVVELKEKLRAVGRAISGNKAELIDRLLQ
jgi:hypothetical protein